LKFGNLEISMPLTRGRILIYDRERMAFRFSMLDGAEEIECQIIAAAIDELVGGPRRSYVDRETQFSQLRDTIERLASIKFDNSAIVRGGVVRIFCQGYCESNQERSGPHGLGVPSPVETIA
jgi:hypothetical protein